jgi:Uma2 family endonuclease
MSEPAHHLFSTADFEKMLALGVLSAPEHMQLIRGRLCDGFPLTADQVTQLNRLTELFVRSAGPDVVGGVRQFVHFADGRVKPDWILTRRDRSPESGGPGPGDLLLVVELDVPVPTSSGETMTPIYAENGVAEYWVIRLIDECLEVHRNPRGDGTYGEVRTRWPGDTTDVIALPGVCVAVADVLQRSVGPQPNDLP